MTAVFRRWLPALSVALLAFAATITSLGSDFTYDDRGVIFENGRVHALRNMAHQLVETYWPANLGGDGYRPVVLWMFTLQWVAGHGSPMLFHAINVLLAVATSLAVFYCAAALMPTAGAWVAAALFAVHPVHVEVTGNVVGQSELVVALCLCLAIGIYLRKRQSHRLDGRAVAIISSLFGIGLFTKEHAIVLPAIFFAAELTVLRGESWRERARETRLLLLSVIAVALVYLFMRGIVQRDLAGFEPYPIFRFLNMTPIDRIGTMMHEMPRIAQLLVFPTHLSADYSPSDVVIANGIDASEVPGAFICAGVAVLAFALRATAPVASFGLMWLIVAFLPVSNLILPAGFVTAERTLFFPSVGVVLVAGALAERVRLSAPRSRQAIAALAVALLLVGGLARSISRQRVWKNNDVFFEALMKDAPNGYRAHFMHARHVGLKSRLREMELEYRRAIRIFPYDAAMTMSIADAYTRAGLCKPAVDLFEWTYGVSPVAADGRYQYAYCLTRLGRWREARQAALDGLRFAHPRDIRLLREAVRQANINLGLPHL
ncbi:MAG: hypothetical protein ABJE47_02785 [bacterium]